MMKPTTCGQCGDETEKPAVVRVVLATIDGEVLDSLVFCQECFDGTNLGSGETLNYA